MIGYYQSPIGIIQYTYEKNVVFSMGFVDQIDNELKNDWINQQLKDYFQGKRQTFDVSVDFHQYTPFQQDVFKALLSIPYGTTKTYLDIAKMIKRPKAYRAVGQACKKNPVGIIIPCHRVIGSQKQLTGYHGKSQIHLKKKLLAHEKNVIESIQKN